MIMIMRIFMNFSRQKEITALIGALPFLYLNVNAQNSDSSKNYPIGDLINITELAKFKNGGELGLQQFIAEHLVYPDSAYEHQMEGRILVQFEIDTFGNVNIIKILGKKKGYGLEEEAIRIVELTSGMWTPAKQMERPVTMRFRIPIKFSLNEDGIFSANDTAYSILDVLIPATYTGGEDSLNAMIQRNLEWPESMGLKCGNFVVILQFIVNTDRMISNIEVTNEVLFDELKTSAIKALKATNGGWSPAYKNNDAVKMKHTLPITFSHIISARR